MQLGSAETALLFSAHTAGDTSQSTLRNFSVASTFSSSVSCFSVPMAGRNPVQRKEHNVIRRAGEVPSVLSAGGEPLSVVEISLPFRAA